MRVDSPASPSRSPFLRRALLALCVGLPLGLAAGELLLRGVLSARGEAHDARALRLDLTELRSRLVDSMPRSGSEPESEREDSENTKIIHPFVGFDDLVSMEQMAQDLRTHRGRDAGTYRILILGGSVAGLFGLQGTERLAQRLEALPQMRGRQVEFMTYARGGHKQPQQILRLVHLLGSGIRADAVLNIDGFNEVAIGNYNRTRATYPTYPSYNHWMRFMQALDEDPQQRRRFDSLLERNAQLVQKIDAALDADFFASALWSSWIHWRIAKRRAEFETLRDEYVEILTRGEVSPGALGPPFQGNAARAVELCVDNWFESSRQIKALCELYDMHYLHVLQPTLHDVGAKPMAPRERKRGGIEASWKRGVLLGYPALRTGGQRLAAEGIDFLDASMIFSEVSEALYYDNCHFIKKGVVMLAERIAVAFEPLLSD